MKKRILALISSAAILTGCSYGLQEALTREPYVESRAKTLTKINISEKVTDAGAILEINSGLYDVLVITDIHIGAPTIKSDETKNIEAFFAKVDSLPKKPAFCIALGDFADHGEDSEYKKYNEKIVEELNSRGIATFNAVGNHDLYNSGWSGYKKFCYPSTSFYKFVTKTGSGNELSWYFLDSASCSMGISQRRKMLEAFKFDMNKKVIATHVPLYADGKFYFAFQDTKERNNLINDFATNNTLVYVTGHTHERHYSDLGGFKEENVDALFYNKTFSVMHMDQTTNEADYTLETIKF